MYVLLFRRAENGPCGYVLVPVDESKAKFTWVINADLKVKLLTMYNITLNKLSEATFLPC